MTRGTTMSPWGSGTDGPGRDDSGVDGLSGDGRPLSFLRLLYPTSLTPPKWVSLGLGPSTF